MQRRDFLKSLVASGALAGAALPAQAAQAATPGADTPILIVCQSDAREAVALGTAVVVALRETDAAAAALVQVGSADLATVPGIEALLARGAGGHVVGVMDDAAAVVFREVAAARGVGYLAQTHHRFEPPQVRHRFTRSGLDGAIAWSDPDSRWTAQIARLYADILTGRAPEGLRAGRPVSPGAARGGLVSFALNI